MDEKLGRDGAEQPRKYKCFEEITAVWKDSDLILLGASDLINNQCGFLFLSSLTSPFLLFSWFWAK